MAEIWLHTNFKVNKFLASLPGIRQYFLGNSGRNLVTHKFWVNKFLASLPGIERIC